MKKDNDNTNTSFSKWDKTRNVAAKYDPPVYFSQKVSRFKTGKCKRKDATCNRQ